MSKKDEVKKLLLDLKESIPCEGGVAFRLKISESDADKLTKEICQLFPDEPKADESRLLTDKEIDTAKNKAVIYCLKIHNNATLDAMWKFVIKAQDAKTASFYQAKIAELEKEVDDLTESLDVCQWYCAKKLDKIIELEAEMKVDNITSLINGTGAILRDRVYRISGSQLNELIEKWNISLEAKHRKEIANLDREIDRIVLSYVDNELPCLSEKSQAYGYIKGFINRLNTFKSKWLRSE